MRELTMQEAELVAGGFWAEICDGIGDIFEGIGKILGAFAL